MKRVSALALLTLIVAACGEPAPGSDVTTSLPGPTSTPAPSPVTIIGGVEVVVTATPVEQPDGSIELCPPGMSGACPGIALVGEIDPGLLTSDDTPIYVKVTGRYDGKALDPSAPPVPFDYGPAVSGDFDSLCPGLEGTRSVNPDESLTEAVTTYATSQPDYAALWWDRESAVLTVWFEGDDVSAHQEAIADLAGDEPVCVAGGAAFSEAELIEASEVLAGFTDSRGLLLASFGYSVGGLGNRVDLPVEEIDMETRRALADLVGDRVALYPFIEMLEGSLADLPDPVPVVAGDVDILTSRVRSGGGMAALGLFRVGYDPALDCVYFGGSESGSEGRTVPVWPFGYAATSSPMTIYDYDGVPVASEGDEIELGGGYVGVDFVDGNVCGADGAWIVSH